MEIYKIFREVDGEDADVDSKWVLRLEFDRRELMNKNITIDDIYLLF